MFRNKYAPADYTFLCDKEIIVRCRKEEFKNQNFIPANFTRLPNLDDVYRMTIPLDATSEQQQTFMAALKTLKHGAEILASYETHLQRPCVNKP